LVFNNSIKCSNRTEYIDVVFVTHKACTRVDIFDHYEETVAEVSVSTVVIR
jgi:hypothetical protein